MWGPQSSATISSWLAIAIVASLLVDSCRPAATVAEHRDIDSDPIALLPPGPVVVASVDVRAVFLVPAFVASATALARAMLPIDDSAGLDASRDVDRITVAQYRSPTGDGQRGTDYVLTAMGRFDPQRLAAVRTTKDGSPVASERYAGFSIQTAGPVSYAALSRRLLLVGTPAAVRRAIDRAKGSALERALKPWVSETIETAGAQLAAAADFESEPVTANSVGTLDLSWLGGLQTARVTGNFEPTGMTIAATLSYADAGQAERGADGLRALARWVKAVGPLIGDVHVQDLQIASRDRDLHCAFAVDDSTLRTLGAVAPRLLPPSGR